MDKGIRQGVNARFAELNEQRLAGEFTGRSFRAEVIGWAMDQYGISLASAATAYNNAKLAYTQAYPEKVEGLGRPPEKNNGGRRRKVQPGQAVDADYTPGQTEFRLLRKKDNSLVALFTDFTELQTVLQTGRYNGRFTGKAYWI